MLRFELSSGQTSECEWEFQSSDEHKAGWEESYLPDLNINKDGNWKVSSSVSPILCLQMRKSGSESLSNLPRDAQTRTRAPIYILELSHAKMDSEPLQLRNRDLDSEEKEIFKTYRKKFPGFSW